LSAQRFAQKREPRKTVAFNNPPIQWTVTRDTDPYGRSAPLTYSPAGQLASITDTLGLMSTFTYGPGDFVAAMRTPYGVTTFRHEWWSGESLFVNRFIEATDPLGGTEHVEFRWQEPALATSVPGAQVPTGFTAWNTGLEWYNTFAWDKQQWALGANDLTKATITRWTTMPEWPGGTSPLGARAALGEAAAREPHLVQIPGPDKCRRPGVVQAAHHVRPARSGHAARSTGARDADRSVRLGP
jgi:YD repeat-containing protein